MNKLKKALWLALYLVWPLGLAIVLQFVLLENTRLRKLNDLIRNETPRAIEENVQLKYENETILDANAQLKTFNGKLKTLNNELKKENDDLRLELDKDKKKNANLKEK